MEILSTLQSIAKAIEKTIPLAKCHCYAMESQILLIHPHKAPDGVHVLIPYYQSLIHKGKFTEADTAAIIDDLRKMGY